MINLAVPNNQKRDNCTLYLDLTSVSTDKHQYSHFTVNGIITSVKTLYI